MGLFDFLKKRKDMEKRYTGNGSSCWGSKSIHGEDYESKRQAEEDFWERRYDLSTVAGIRSIPVPREEEQSSESLPNVTGRIEYYLIMKGGRYQRTGDVELALACYRKANELMPMSPIMYQRDYYMRLPRYLRKLRRFDEARIEEGNIEKMFSSGSDLSDADEAAWRANRADSLRWAEEDGSDLVEVSWVSGCCETCGKYRGRIFSMNGLHARFPRFPSDFCEKCGLTYFPFLYGFSEPVYTKKRGKALIREMNKPFQDTRTTEDILNYREILEREGREAIKRRNSEDYDWLWEFLPELCPKSLSGYVRMKNSNSKNYLRIVDEAKRLGRNID